MAKLNKSDPNTRPQVNIVADCAICIWMLVVATAYYGPLINPHLSRAASYLSPFYALMLISSILLAALRLLRRDAPASDVPPTPKSRH